MQKREQLAAWKQTVEVIQQLLANQRDQQWMEDFENTLYRSEMANPWFTNVQLKTALEGICRLLEEATLEKWMLSYPNNTHSPLNVGIIMAGNIPLAGFHDFLSVLSSGNKVIAKLSASDQYLLPFVARIFFSFIPKMESRFEVASQLKQIDAIIATGSNNTSRYFEYYFGKMPHVFRKNRNSAAIITGTENEFDFMLLGRDIFTYYGMGCRNVSKLFVPRNYSFNLFFENISSFGEVMQHNKYMNNFDYHQALYLLNRQNFLTNNFLIVIEEKALSSPVGVLHFEYYDDEQDLNNKLQSVKEELQCVVGKKGPVHYGQAQFPAIDDYADGFDTMAFLASLNKN
ncbi:MAG: acyl-CoA reductase [Bacteroidota bacterium]|nr:acyl-CoA reductase [Bacteroidota bacterium]